MQSANLVDAVGWFCNCTLHKHTHFHQKLLHGLSTCSAPPRIFLELGVKCLRLHHGQVCGAAMKAPQWGSLTTAIDWLLFVPTCTDLYYVLFYCWILDPDTSNIWKLISQRTQHCMTPRLFGESNSGGFWSWVWPWGGEKADIPEFNLQGWCWFRASANWSAWSQRRPAALIRKARKLKGRFVWHSHFIQLLELFIDGLRREKASMPTYSNDSFNTRAQLGFSHRALHKHKFSSTIRKGSLINLYHYILILLCQTQPTQILKIPRLLSLHILPIMGD